MRIKITITVVALLLLSLFTTTSCASFVQQTDTVSSADVGWTIIKSPVTGRHYEVITMWPNTRNAAIAMSEVTQAEYEDYVLRK